MILSWENRIRVMARDTHIYGEIDSTRGDGRAIIPKVKRVYIAGEVSNWEAVPSKSAPAERFMGY